MATQYDLKLVTQGKAGAAVVGGAIVLADSSTEGRISAGLAIAGLVPGVGQFAATGSVLFDTYRTARALG